MQLRVESSHEEGGLRDWSVKTVSFSGDEAGKVKQLHAVRVSAPPRFETLPGSEFTDPPRGDRHRSIARENPARRTKTSLLDASGMRRRTAVIVARGEV